MLSGNGRHRRPRQAPALLVAAGVTGSAIAIPLLGASGASAADGTTWDRVAECETGGAWSANDGYGHFGGLRLTQTDWETYGGLDYAPSPEQASRQQQIAVAERVLADQGVTAWPTCGPLSGLGEDSAPADVDTGVSDDASSGLGGLIDTPQSSDTSGSSDSSRLLPSPSESASSSDGSSTEADGESADSDASDRTTQDDQDNTTKTDRSPDSDADPSEGSDATSQGPDSSATGEAQDDSDKSGQSGTSSDETATGRHRGDSADEGVEEGVADGRTGDSTGRHASRSGAVVRDAADGEYTVRAGDSLWGIADSLGLQGGWSELYAENRQTVGTDPDLILPGQTLAVGVEPVEK
ncbi:nucleoid-associated protein YgaU [Streptomyces sp. SAI-170]|uniref:LysM peptidoglycan-binding domain-containing protein n=1 Tax=Streptomyces sp. SAI-170 TaxID=3377729 RepID=UPI003C7EC073